jgi:hypothetical protein
LHPNNIKNMNISEINQKNLSLLDVNQLKAFLDIFKGVSNPRAKVVIRDLARELSTRKMEAVEEASIKDIIKAVKAATKKIGGIIDKVFDDKGFQDAFAKYIDNPKDKNRLKKIQDYTNGMLSDMSEESDLEEANVGLEDGRRVLVKALTKPAALRLQKKLRNKFSNYDFNIDKSGLNIIVPNEKPVTRYLQKQPEVDTIGEATDLEEAKYPLYHKTFTSAAQAALDLAKKQGFEVDEDDWFNQVSTGPKKPGKGKTNRYIVKVTKNGKETRKRLAFQVYGMDSGKYELNAYVEATNLEEMFNRLKPDDVRDSYGTVELKYRSTADIRDAEDKLKKAGINSRKNRDTLKVDSDSPAFKKAKITSTSDSSKREKAVLKVLGESVELQEAIKSWEVIVIKPVNRLKKNQKVVVKAANTVTAIKKAAKLFKIDDKLITGKVDVKLLESTELEEAALPFKELEKAWIRTKGNDKKREKLIKKHKLKPLISNVRQGSIKLGPLNDLNSKTGNHTIAGLDADGELIFISNNPIRIHYPSNVKDRPRGEEMKEDSISHQRLIRVVEVALGERPEDTNEFIKEASIDLTMTPSSIQKAYKKFNIKK